jgi:proline iminopeptidase
MATQPSHAWQVLYPPLQAHDHGWLDVGDGHELYWETAGNPLGLPALFVHGGPGAGCTADDRRWFDPRRYRIVLFDQRGCGRSRPPGRLAANDTAHLVADIESLRRHLRVGRWLLFGGSWGATLALAYAQRHPARVHALVLRGVFTATQRERQWLYGASGAAALEPAAWRRLVAAVPGAGQTDLLRVIAARLHCGDRAGQAAAANAWLQWEQDLMDSEAPEDHPGDAQPVHDASCALAMARIGVHFARQAFFLGEAQLLHNAARLRAVPGVIVHGARDRVAPPAAAQALHAAWPGSRLCIVEQAGHASSHPGMAQQLVAATDFFGTGQGDPA